MKKPSKTPLKRRAQSQRIVAAKIINGFWKADTKSKHEFLLPINDKLATAMAEGWEPLSLSVESGYYHVLMVKRKG